MQQVNYLNSILKKNTGPNPADPKSKQANSIRSSNLIEERLKRDQRAAKKDEVHLTIDYISNQIQNLNQVPLLVLCKSILIMSDEYFLDLIGVAWCLLLNSDQEIASSAGWQ